MYIRDNKQKELALKIAKTLEQNNIIYNYVENDFSNTKYGKENPQKAYSIFLYVDEEDVKDEIFNAIKAKYKDFSSITKKRFSIEINITIEKSIQKILESI